MRHRGLEQVTGVVQLVAATQILPAGLAHAADRLLGRLADLAHGVQVAVRLLSGRDLGDHVVELPVQRRVGLPRQGEGGAFDHFVDVRVVEPEHALERSLGLSGGHDEVLDSPGALAALEVVLDGDRCRSVSIRGAQNASAISVWVNGTGWIG